MRKINTLLLVDDDEDDQDFFREALKKVDAAITLLSAYNGEQGLDLLQQPDAKIPDLIFLDLNMPLMNGEIMLGKLKQIPSLQHIPVIIYTTMKGRDQVERFQRMGAADFLSKPYYINEITALIHDVLSKDWWISQSTKRSTMRS